MRDMFDRETISSLDRMFDMDRNGRMNAMEDALMYQYLDSFSKNDNNDEEDEEDEEDFS